MQENIMKLGVFGKIELISAILYLVTGKLLYTFVGKGISTMTLILWMFVFTILLIVFAKRHVYRQDKPLLTALSVYYKSLAYVVIIFTMCNWQGKDTLSVVMIVSIVVYMVLSYINRKQYDQMLNAYLYLCMGSIARLSLFLQVS